MLDRYKCTLTCTIDNVEKTATFSSIEAMNKHIEQTTEEYYKSKSQEFEKLRRDPDLLAKILKRRFFSRQVNHNQ